jgi:hypothetical protein
VRLSSGDLLPWPPFSCEAVESLCVDESGKGHRESSERLRAPGDDCNHLQRRRSCSELLRCSTEEIVAVGGAGLRRRCRSSKPCLRRFRRSSPIRSGTEATVRWLRWIADDRCRGGSNNDTAEAGFLSSGAERNRGSGNVGGSGQPDNLGRRKGFGPPLSSTTGPGRRRPQWKLELSGCPKRRQRCRHDIPDLCSCRRCRGDATDQSVSGPGSPIG